MCFQESDLPFMQHPAVKKEKLHNYENDNDYASDQEQVLANRKTIMQELEASLKAFIQGDALTEVINLENTFIPGVVPKGIDQSEALVGDDEGNKTLQRFLQKSLATPFSISTSYKTPEPNSKPTVKMVQMQRRLAERPFQGPEIELKQELDREGVKTRKMAQEDEQYSEVARQIEQKLM